MKAYKFLIFILVFLPFCLNAQIQVRLHQPPPNQLMIEHLWWVDLNNQTPETYTVYLRGEITEEQEGLIFRGNSNTFELPPGMTRITPGDITETWDVWYQPEYEEYIIRTGRPPEGNYTVCIYVIIVGTDMVIGEHCIFVSLLLAQPPRLISPIEGMTILEEYPLFTWTAPVPLPPGEPVIYNLRIVEVLEGQTQEEAIAGNIPWYEEGDIGRTSFRYPISAQAFEPDKKYAWQIQAFYESGYPIGENEGRSEIGTFSTERITPIVTLPQVLFMGGFTLDNIAYQSGSTLDSLSGDAESFFFHRTSYGSSFFLLTPVKFELDFKNLSTKMIGNDTAEVISGEVIQKFGKPLKVLVGDYPTYVHEIHLWPDSAHAQLSIGLPCMYEEKGCNLAQLGPFDTRIAPEVDFYKELEAKERGPYRLGETGIKILSLDIVIIDLSTTITPADMGIILKKGETVEQKDLDTTNTGYLYGKYTFNEGLITPSGLSTDLVLSSTCDFSSLAPLGFQISLNTGSLEIDSCRVKQGKFTKGTITLPQGVNGVQNRSGNAVSVSIDSLSVDTLLNLFGVVDIQEEIQWGGFGFVCKTGKLRLVSSPRPFTEPIDGDSFKTYTIPERDTFPGLTLECRDSDTLTVYSSDAEEPINFPGNVVKGWLNLEMQGISGRIQPIPDRRPDLYAMLGDRKQPGYLADSAFNTIIGHYYHDTKDSLMNVEFMFAGNSAFDSDLGGQFKIPYPSKIKPPFNDLEVTSTASFAGGKVEFDSVMTLDYWGVGITSERGIVSVKVGEIIYMKAAISETLHFEEPFNVHWGEMLADGDLKRFYFDYNSGNQKFDGFPFTVHHASLSEYKPTTGNLKGYLKAKGDIHFSFWGSKHDTIWDYKYEKHPKDPYYSRYVKVVPAFFAVERNWGSGTAYLKFDKVWYDSLDQNGFKGSGTVKVMKNIDGMVDADMDLSSMMTNICYCSTTEKVKVGGSLTPVLLSGVESASKVQPLSGCITIRGDKLERIYFEGAFELAGEAGWIGFGGGVEVAGAVSLEITPQRFTLATRTQASIILMKMVGLQGTAAFKLVLGNGGLEGDIQGRFEPYPSTALLIDMPGIGIQGHFNFFVGLNPKKPVVYFQGSGEAWYNLGTEISFSAAIFAGVNAPLKKIWALDEIKKGPNVRTILKDDLGIGNTLTGFYIAGKLSFGINAWVISGGYDMWGGIGCFVDPERTPYCVGHAGVGIHGSILGGLASASAWVQLSGFVKVALPVEFTICGDMGFEACVVWGLYCIDWDGTLCLGTSGIKAE